MEDLSLKEGHAKADRPTKEFLQNIDTEASHGCSTRCDSGATFLPACIELRGASKLSTLRKAVASGLRLRCSPQLPRGVGEALLRPLFFARHPGPLLWRWSSPSPPRSAAHDRMSWRLAYARDSRSHSRRLCLPLSPSSAHGESRDVRVENRSYLMRSLISMNTSMVEERQGLIQQSNEASASADRLRLQMDDMRDKHQLQLDEAVDRARQEERDRFELEKKELKAEHDRALRLAQAGI
eukprot:s588_g18.t1